MLQVNQNLKKENKIIESFTRSTSNVRQGECFFVSLILIHLAFWAVFKALVKFSGASSRNISLASSETPSNAYSSKKWPCILKEKKKTHKYINKYLL